MCCESLASEIKFAQNMNKKYKRQCVYAVFAELLTLAFSDVLLDDGDKPIKNYY